MIRIRQIKIEVEKDTKEELAQKISHILRINPSKIEFNITKKSLDARKKEQLIYVYEVDVKVKNEKKVLKEAKSKDIFLVKNETYKFVKLGNDKLSTNPIIVGSGPSGLFCAYMLAEKGYHPIIIERGSSIEDRVKIVEEFWNTGKLDKNTNVQFGEGGAGTFSDGKLNTLVHDKQFRGKKVFEIFIENGAPEEIMYINKPHIGTDLLRNIIINIRNKIIERGGIFKYNTCLTNLIIKDNKLEMIEINHKEKIPCNLLVLAIGHSARDTLLMLKEKKIKMNPKPFAIGVRMQHPQEMINESQYGKKYKYLPPCSYKITYQTKKNRGVYSFCMCPGGYVVNASSEEGYLVVNGMSNHKRDTGAANSAIVVTITPEDFGENILDGINFQRNLEKLAYQKGNGKIPLQLYKDFCENKKSTKLGRISPITKGYYSFSNLNEILPDYTVESIKEAIPYFGKKIKGFDRDDALLFGIESRTSSPVRIERNEYLESNIKGIYPCGEGSGYAGGITTAAIDGIKVAEEIASRYQPNDVK